MIKNSNLTKSEARDLVQKCFRDLVEQTELQPPFVASNGWAEMDIAEQRDAALDRVDRLRDQMTCGNFERTVELVADSYVPSGVELSPVRRRDVLEGIARALIEQQHLFILRLTDRLQEFSPSDPLFGSTDVPVKLISPAEHTPPDYIGPNLGDAAAQYLAAGQRRWVQKTHAARVWQVGYLVDCLGSTTPLAAVSSHDVRRFRDQVLSLRANHGRRRHMTFSERQTENADKRLAPKSAAIIFDTAKAFFAWAKSDEGMIAANPAADVRIAVQKGPKGLRTRRPLTAEELTALFSSTVFTGCKSRHRRFVCGSAIIRDAKFWIPVLGYYTGARMGELVQLHVADVILTPIPHISINEDFTANAERKHVKSAAGIRLVPLHPDLLQLGFADFVASAAAKGKSKRLFPDVEFGCDGQASSRFSKWFARCMESAGLTDRALVFHSFRHNAEDAFRDAEKPQYLIDRVIGHSDGSTSAQYGHGVSLDVLNDAVSAMRLRVRLPDLWQIAPP